MLRVNLGSRSYDVAVVRGDAAGLGAFVRQRCPGERTMIIADENLMSAVQGVAQSLHAVGYHPLIATISPGEPSKSLAVAARLYDALAGMPADRATPIVAVGGGVVGDVAGFVAATWHRGLPIIHVPTSLLAMVDSAIGGKGGINHAQGKNLIGAIHQPAGVWIDLAHLATLPEREFRSGLAEVVKHGVILDAEFFAWLETTAEAILARDSNALERVVSTCCAHKAGVVEQDEREIGGGRMILNYGHTFGHAFEAAAGYRGWTHGEAVAAGMICASRLAERLGRIPPQVTTAQISLLERFGLPTAPDRAWPIDAILTAMQRDKKALHGRLRFVLPTRIGHVELVSDVPEAAVRAVLA